MVASSVSPAKNSSQKIIRLTALPAEEQDQRLSTEFNQKNFKYFTDRVVLMSSSTTRRNVNMRSTRRYDLWVGFEAKSIKDTEVTTN